MESKSALRRIVRDRGELYDGRTRAAMSQRVMEAVGRFPPFADAASVALYWIHMLSSKNGPSAKRFTFR